jgi:hypothetical protein
LGYTASARARCPAVWSRRDYMASARDPFPAELLRRDCKVSVPARRAEAMWAQAPEMFARRRRHSRRPDLK